MILLLLISLVVPILLGLMIAGLLWPRIRSLRSDFLFLFSLACGLGLGLSSCLFFLWLSFFPSLSSNFFLTFALPETFLLILFGALFFFRRKNKKTFAKKIVSSYISTNSKKSGLILPSIFFFLLIVAIIFFIRTSVQSPHGAWDAWAIWNLHAKFLFAGGDYWKNVFSNVINYSHPDYPLLIPSIIARSWKFIGRETIDAPMAVAMIFTFATVGIIFSSIKILRGKKQAFLAGIILLATSSFIAHGASQYADIPLGFYILTAIVLSYLYDKEPQTNGGFLILAGLAVGLAGWTKNEGLLFIAAIFISRLIAVAVYREWKSSFKEILLFLTGLLPILAIIIFFKLRFAPPSDIFNPQNVDAASSGGVQTLIQKLTDVWRYVIILKAFVNQIINFNPLIIGLVPLLFIYLFIVRIRIARKNIPALLTPILTICLTSIGYFFIYQTYSQDINWYLNTSLYRLFLQLWPAIVFLFFLLASTPEQMLSQKRKKINKKIIIL